jgi:hypothetical protein
MEGHFLRAKRGEKEGEKFFVFSWIFLWSFVKKTLFFTHICGKI